MSDERCEPPEELRDIPGWHWIKGRHSTGPLSWLPARGGRCGQWMRPCADDQTPEELAAIGCIYLWPVPTNAELAAAKEREAGLVAALKVIANFPLPEQDDFHGTNMRAVAARTLDTHAPNWGTTP